MIARTVIGTGVRSTDAAATRQAIKCSYSGSPCGCDDDRRHRAGRGMSVRSWASESVGEASWPSRGGRAPDLVGRRGRPWTQLGQAGPFARLDFEDAGFEGLFLPAAGWTLHRSGRTLRGSSWASKLWDGGRCCVERGSSPGALPSPAWRSPRRRWPATTTAGVGRQLDGHPAGRRRPDRGAGGLQLRRRRRLCRTRHPARWPPFTGTWARRGGGRFRATFWSGFPGRRSRLTRGRGQGASGGPCRTPHNLRYLHRHGLRPDRCAARVEHRQVQRSPHHRLTEPATLRLTRVILRPSNPQDDHQRGSRRHQIVAERHSIQAPPVQTASPDGLVRAARDQAS